MRQPGEEFGRRRRNHDLIGPARELDVAHRGFGRLVPQIRAHRLAGDGLKRQRRDELLRAARHHDLHVGAALDQAADEIRALVGGDAAGDAEQNLAGLRAHGRGLWARAAGRGKRPARIPAFRAAWTAERRFPDEFAGKSTLGRGRHRRATIRAAATSPGTRHGMSIRDWPAGERPREKLLETGPAAR